MESEQRQEHETQEAMPISRKPAPKKLNTQLNKKGDDATGRAGDQQPKVYKQFKLRTKEGSISDGVALSQGTVVVKRLHGGRSGGGCVALEVGEKLYEMVTTHGATVSANGSQLFASIHNQQPILIVPQNGKQHFFTTLSGEQKLENTTLYNWYSHLYYEIFDPLVPELVPITTDDLVEYFPNVIVTRPSLAPIEAAEDTKLYRLTEGESLFLGSQDAATNVEGMLASGVTHVLCVATGIAYARDERFQYCTIEIIDTPESMINEYFGECFAFIDAALKEGGCLVHCNAGVSRSATICIAYLMKTKHLTFPEAHAQVKGAKKDVKPNEGFAKQLLAYDVTLAMERSNRAGGSGEK